MSYSLMLLVNWVYYCSVIVGIASLKSKLAK
jgi:hypothetical protein